MARDKGGNKGKGSGRIKNEHLIGAGGGEITKKPGITRAEQAAEQKGKPGTEWTKKVPQKATAKSHAEQIRPTRKEPTKPQAKKPVSKTVKVPTHPSQAPSAKKSPTPIKKPVAPTIQKATKKAPSKGVSAVKAKAAKIAPVKKKAPTKSAPRKGR